MFDPLTYRVWRLYMAGSAVRFFAGQRHIFQTLLTSPMKTIAAWRIDDRNRWEIHGGLFVPSPSPEASRAG
jgi:hypothetical protein